MAELSPGSHKAKVEVSAGLGSYLDALGEVCLQDHSVIGRTHDASQGLSQPLRATTSLVTVPLPSSGQSRQVEHQVTLPPV